MKIHAIGDSHVYFFDMEPFVVHYIGSKTAYNLYNKKELWDVIKTIPKGEIVMLCLGEIDCRCHIAAWSEIQERTLEDVTKECVERYFRVILKIKEMGYDTIVWLVNPQSPTRVGKGEMYALVGPDGSGKTTTCAKLANLVKRAETAILELVMITNRGVKVWHQGFEETLNTDHWRCRFLMKPGNCLTKRAIAELQMRLAHLGVDFIKTEHLCTFDGEPGYSLGQGQ